MSDDLERLDDLVDEIGVTEAIRHILERDGAFQYRTEGVETGRFSASHPNVANTPKGRLEQTAYGVFEPEDEPVEAKTARATRKPTPSYTIPIDVAEYVADNGSLPFHIKLNSQAASLCGEEPTVAWWGRGRTTRMAITKVCVC